MRPKEKENQVGSHDDKEDDKSQQKTENSKKRKLEEDPNNKDHEVKFCALCPGVVDWHNCGTVLDALEFGWGLVCII